MPFDYDIFISYGHLDDDQDAYGDIEGWVDLLTKRLPGQVAKHIGYKPNIWRDEQNLQGNDQLWEAIKSGISSSLIFVPVLSPRYVLSEWCPRELKMFCESAPPPNVDADSFRSRIFKVVKTPPLLANLKDKVPKELRDLTGYDFYEMAGNMPREFSPDVVNGKDQKYWDTLNRLAWHIAGSLAKLKPEQVVVQPSVTPQTSSDTGQTKFVYVVETTSDLAEQRERVRDELGRRGYGVLPKEKIRLDEVKKTVEVVEADLKRCVLSVHLVGAKYGLTPEDDTRSIVLIQEELAAARELKDASFQRLIWVPVGLNSPGAEVTDQRQKGFIESLPGRVTARTELLQNMTIEDLKTRIVEKLTPPTNTPPRPGRRSKFKHVYLICENRDRALVRPIKKYLSENCKFEVIAWFDDGVGKLTDYHRQNLKDCDAALIYFGNADEPWVRKNIDDIDKAFGYGRENEWSASAVYVGEPPSEEKEDFLTNLVPVIHHGSAFDPTVLKDFVSAVQSGNGGQA